MVGARDAYRWKQKKANRILPGVVGSPQRERALEASDTLFRWLRTIESFVEYVRNDGSIKLEVYARYGPKVALRNGPSFLHFRHVGKFSLSVLADNCTYSCSVELFRVCWQKCCGMGEYSDLEDCAARQGKMEYELFNELVEEIGCGVGEPLYKKAVRKRHLEATKNYRAAADYVSPLYATYPYLRTFVLDLFYGVSPEGTTTAEIKEDLRRLVNNCRRNLTLFDRHVGYVWTLQWLATVGWCVSVAFFYADAYGLDEGGIAENIGRYWRAEITQERGRYAIVQSWPHSIYPQIQFGDVQAKAREEVLHEIRYMIFSRLYSPIPVNDAPPMRTRWFGTGGRMRAHSP